MNLYSGFKKSICGIVTTAFLCAMPYVANPAYAGSGVWFSKNEMETPWVQQVRNGVGENGATIDAHVEEKDGESVIVEEEHPFDKPAGYKEWASQKVSVFPSIEKDGDKKQSEVHYYYNTDDSSDIFLVLEIGGTRAAYFHGKWEDDRISSLGAGRGSYDADENFEQSNSRPTFHYDEEKYFPDLAK